MAIKSHRFDGNGTTASVAAAFTYARTMKERGVNVRVTNNSWGGAPEAASYDQALKDAIDAAGNAGILNVCAAGNDNSNNDVKAFYPATYDSPSIISVAASDDNDNKANFSSYGPTTVDLAAPGTAILSTYGSGDSNYATLSGTSMATPHVSGAAALLLSYNPTLTVAQLKSALLDNVDVLPQWSGLTLTSGRLNVARALQALSTPTPTPTPTAPPKRSKTGIFRPSTGEFFLDNSSTSGIPDVSFVFGIPGDFPVAGDWNGDGVDTPGVYRNGVFYLRNSNSSGFADLIIPFGQSGDQPITGDWDGDGIDTIGVYRNGTFFLRNSNTPGPPDIIFTFGIPGDIAIVGDWNGDGVVTCGVFRPSTSVVYLRNSNTTGFADLSFTFGNAGDKPVAGDWNGDGITTIGIYRNGVFFLSNSNSTGFADTELTLGSSGDIPIVGNWNGSP